MLFLFVHFFVINLVNGLCSFLCKVLGLFYMKIYILYIHISRSAYKSTPSMDVKKVKNLTPAYMSTLEQDLRLWAAGSDICKDAWWWQNVRRRAGNAKTPPGPPATTW